MSHFATPTYNSTSAFAKAYRYGFNGQEKDDEVKGSDNSLDFGARIYDPRVGRFLSIDPKTFDFPANSPYDYAADNPIAFDDNNGEGPRYKAIAKAFEQQLQSMGIREATNDNNGNENFNYQKIERDDDVFFKVQLTQDGKTYSKVFHFGESTSDSEGEKALRDVGVPFGEAMIVAEASWFTRMKYKMNEADHYYKKNPTAAIGLEIEFLANVLTFGEGGALKMAGKSYLSAAWKLLELSLTANSLSEYILAENQTVLEDLGVSKKTLDVITTATAFRNFATSLRQAIKTAMKNPNATEATIDAGKALLYEIYATEKLFKTVMGDDYNSESESSKEDANKEKDSEAPKK